MVVKQFLLGIESKQYLTAIRELIRKVDFAGDEFIRIENGFVLNKVIANTDIRAVDWQSVIQKKIKTPETSESDTIGKTVKFKLSDSSYNKINDLVVLLSDTLDMRIYRAYAVKLFLKNYYIINFEKE